jgi:hypothetical protein
MDQDQQSGINGLPQRLGKKYSIITALVLIALGALTILHGPHVYDFRDIKCFS